MIRHIKTEAIDSYWPIVSGLIEPALDEETSILDVYNKLMDEMMSLLSISIHGEIVAACVCEFVDYPRISALRVVAVGGDRMKEWLPDLIDALDEWAEDSKIDRIEQMGRDGWMKVLKGYGYRKRYTFMTKELSYG